MYPTTCPDCGDAVYFFSCSCGSQVFFDQPGKPWPQHSERCIEYMVRRYKEEEHLSFADIQIRVRNWARERDLEVKSDVMKRIAVMANRALGSTTVLEIAPGEPDVSVEGSITLLDLQVNILKRLKVLDTPIARGLYAPLLRDPMAELSVCGERNNTTGFASRFTFYYPLAEVRKRSLRIGARVGCILETLELPGDKRVWLGTDVCSLRS